MYICVHGYPYLYTSGKIDVADHRRSQYITHRQITQPATYTNTIKNTDTNTNTNTNRGGPNISNNMNDHPTHQN